MTCNLSNTPLFPEPLPLYRRDPETASTISSAPSYHSEAPTYHSRRQSVAQQPSLLAPAVAGSSRGLLPSPRYAPGYESRAHGSVGDVECLSFNASQWSNIHSSHASKQYQAVASRRANAARASPPSSLINGLTPNLGQTPSSASIPTLATTGSGGSASVTASAVNGSAYQPTPEGETNSDAVQQPMTPHEDPALVGESAAARARSQRVYREMCMRNDPAAIQLESQTWDFMLSQMNDWDQRTESWRKFRADVDSRGGMADKVRFGLGLGGGSKLLVRGGLRGRR